MNPRQRTALPERPRPSLSALRRRALQPASRTRPVASPQEATDVARVLRPYLAKRLPGGAPRYRQAPMELPDGWETHNYLFQLEDDDRLPPAFTQPLIARFFADHSALPRARHEWSVLQHLHRLNFPVTAPILLEENCNYLGGPFLLRAHAHGQTLLRSTF